MASMKELFQSADWKTEKHVPVIDAPAKAQKGVAVKITVTVGKELAHPNTSEHHIAWIALCFLPEGEKFPYHLGRFEFTAHGASVQGPNTSTLYTQPEATVVVKTDKPGTLFATSYCNIHGFWEDTRRLDVA